jgi:hypothetical protein
MKKQHFFLSLLVLGALVTGSCKKQKVDLHFDMNVSTINFVVDTTSSTGNVSLASTSFTSNLNQTLSDNSINIKDVESIKLTGAEFTIESPAGANFNVIDKVYSYLSAPGLVETRIAYLDTVPQNVSYLSLHTDAADIKEYLNQPVVSFRVGGITNAPHTVRDSVHAVLTFRITAAGQL